jgi:hypothetical protein
MRLLSAHADGVPLLGVLRTSAVAGASWRVEEPLSIGRTEPRPPFQRRPAKSAAFQATGMPFTITTREGQLEERRGRIAPSGLHAGSLAHAAHTFSSGRRKVFLDGPCKVTVQSPADP